MAGDRHCPNASLLTSTHTELRLVTSLLCPPELGFEDRVRPTLVLVLLGVLGRFGTWYLRVFPVVVSTRTAV